jgi:hypothetical protein
MEFIDRLFIIVFINFVHRGRASFFLRKYPRREFPPCKIENIPDMARWNLGA